MKSAAVLVASPRVFHVSVFAVLQHNLIFIGIDSLKYSVLQNSGGEINLETNNFATQGTVDTCTASQHQENSLYI